MWFEPPAERDNDTKINTALILFIISLLIAIVMLATTYKAHAANHCFSVWYYPFPQNCNKHMVDIKPAIRYTTVSAHEEPTDSPRPEDYDKLRQAFAEQDAKDLAELRKRVVDLWLVQNAGIEEWDR